MSKKRFNFDFFLNLHLIFKIDNLIPDYEIDHLLELEKILASAQIKGIIFDVDQTLVPFKESDISKEISEFTRSLNQTFTCCILSNYPNLESRIKRIRKIEDQVGIKVIHASRKKPDPGAFQEALEYLQTKPEQTLMVGDRIFTDIIGANYLGIKTALIKPIDRSTDPVLEVRIPRIFEEGYLRLAKFLRKRQKRGG